MNEIRDEDVMTLYQALLFERWYSLSEKERRQYVRRMLHARYGSYKDYDLFALIDIVKDTQLYQQTVDEDFDI